VGIDVRTYAETTPFRQLTEIVGVPPGTVPRPLKRHGRSQVLKGFVDSILGGSPISPSGEERLRARTIKAICRSAKLGGEFRVEDEVGGASARH
jgi:hypothetical protein